jgi:hypothetical protein
VNRILFAIVAAILILGIFVGGGCPPCTVGLPEIIDADIWADNSSPPQYFLYVVCLVTAECVHFDSYSVTHSGDTTVIVEVLYRRCPAEGCAEKTIEVEQTIPLGGEFVRGVNYTVEVKSFVAEV